MKHERTKGGTLKARTRHTLRTVIDHRFGSVAGFARDTGIDRTQIYRAIRGSGIALETARRIAVALGLSLDGFVELYDQGAGRRAAA